MPTPGGYCFDFDLYLSSDDDAAGKKLGNPQWVDAYVIEWGSGRMSSSFTDMIKVCERYYGLSRVHSAWKQYISKGGCTIWFTKFQNDDKNIKNSTWWNRL